MGPSRAALPPNTGPDEEGIVTSARRVRCLQLQTPNTGPDEEGIVTRAG